MATAGNPILYALQGLGTSISTLSTAEAQRRRDELAATTEENTQRRSLEALRLSGEQQMAKLGIEEAKTRFDIGMGEKKFGLLEQQSGREERTATQNIAASQQTVAASQGQERRAETLLPEQIAAQRATRAAAAAQEQHALAALNVEKERLIAAQRTNRLEDALDKPTTLGAVFALQADKLIGGAGKDTALPLLKLMDLQLQGLGYTRDTPLASGRDGLRIQKLLMEINPELRHQATQLAFQGEVNKYPEGSPERKQRQAEYDTAYPKTKDIATLSKAYEEAVRAGNAPASETFLDWQINSGVIPAPDGYTKQIDAFAYVKRHAPPTEKAAFEKASPQERTKMNQAWQDRATDLRKQYGPINTIGKFEESLAPTPPPQAPPPAAPAPAVPAVLAPLSGTAGRPGSLAEKRARYLPELAQAWTDLLSSPGEGPRLQPSRVLSVIERQRLENAYVAGRALGRTQEEMLGLLRNLLQRTP